MPSISGIQMSSNTSRGCSAAIVASALRPLSASKTRKPSSVRTPRTLERICSSSSTMRIVSAMASLSFYRKLNDEATALGLVVAHANEGAMVGEDRRDDRQPEAGPLSFRGEIRLEESRLDLGRHARAVVRQLEAYRSEEHTSELQSLRHLVCRLL